MYKIVAIIMTLAVVGGTGWWMYGNKKEPLREVMVQNEVAVLMENDNLYIDVGEKRISMVSLKVNGVKGITVNKDVFNSEMVNKTGPNGQTDLILGVMKATKDLPTGKILIGNFTGGVVTGYEGKVTVVGEGGKDPYEVEVGK